MECVSKDRLESFVVSKNDPYRGRVLRLLDPSDNPSTLPAFGPAMAGNLWRLLGANYSEEAALEKAWDLPVGKILACGRGRVFRQRDSLCYFEKSPASEKCILEWKSQNKAVLDVPGPGDQGNAKAEEQVWLWQAYAELGHEFSLTDPSGMPLDRHKALDHGWTIRPWMPGDRCAVNKGKMKLVSDLLQEHRIERPFKDSWPLICLNGRSVGCPLPSMTNRWESVEGEFAIQWRWNSTLVYAYGH
jgi:tRNA(Ile)-lysidine synthetase-like protein